MDESEEAGSELIETGGDPSELLELEEKGFHKMALLVKPPIDIPRIGIIWFFTETWGIDRKRVDKRSMKDF